MCEIRFASTGVICENPFPVYKKKLFKPYYINMFLNSARKDMMWVFVCVESTQWGHVERGRFT